MAEARPSKLHVLAPCFNESGGIAAFLDDFAGALRDQEIRRPVELYLVDDGSLDDTVAQALAWQSPLANFRVSVYALPQNVGHQMAIYSGFVLLARHKDLEQLLVMDSDGEDDPSVLGKILATDPQNDVVFVSRGKRNEGVVFRALYTVYRALFYLITGRTIDFGNYCLLSARMVRELARESFFTHLAATLSGKRVKKTSVMADRRPRLHGSSKMNLSALVRHGFLSLIVYAEDLVMWFLKIAMILMAVFVSMIAYTLYEKLFTNTAVLGWASVLSIGFFNAALTSMGFFVIGLLLLRLRHLVFPANVPADLAPLRAGKSSGRAKPPVPARRARKKIP